MDVHNEKASFSVDGLIIAISTLISQKSINID